MATIRRLPLSADTDGLLPSLARLARLELELGLSEARALLVGAAVALAVALVGLIALVAALVVLVAAVPAPFVGARWEHLVIAGGAVVIVAAAAIAWSLRRLRHLGIPRTAIDSFEDNWRWLGAQLKSRLTLR